jgi:hypothetical protein
VERADLELVQGGVGVAHVLDDVEGVGDVEAAAQRAGVEVVHRRGQPRWAMRQRR